MSKHISGNRGFVGSIVLVIVAFILLKYFLGLGPKAAIDLVWSYISKPVLFVWNHIVWPLLQLAWGNLQTLLNTGKLQGMPPVPQI